MTDLFDHAQATEALETDAALRAQQLRAALAEKVQPTGECLNPLCGEPLDPPQLFCNSQCAREHARRSK
jgi:hypothetical protein